LSGVPIPARWWSLTIYDQSQFLPRNTDQASSIDATRALAADKTMWQGVLSPDRPAGDVLWLSSTAGGTFSVTLRLYNPASTDPTQLAKLAFPKIELVSCAGSRQGSTGR
jgi:hypothetical protein